MDKKLIERAIQETMRERAAQNPMYNEAIIDDESIAFFAAVFARIDAERGKSAIAYGVLWRSGDGKEVLQFPVASTLDEAKSDLSMYVQGDQDSMRAAPLFLFPTIPEGMALVSKEILDKFPEINTSNYNHDDACALNAWGVELVLSAQGERNAD